MYWCHTALSLSIAEQLTPLEKIILLLQSVFSRLCWVPSSVFHSFCYLWSASSLFSVTIVNPHHPQDPNTLPLFSLLADGIASYFAQKTGENSWCWYNFYIIFSSHLLLLLYSIFQVVAMLSTQLPKPTERESSFITHQSSIIHTFSVLPHTSQIWPLIPPNTDLHCPHHLLENNWNSFSLGLPASGFFPLQTDYTYRLFDGL